MPLNKSRLKALLRLEAHFQRLDPHSRLTCVADAAGSTLAEPRSTSICRHAASDGVIRSLLLFEKDRRSTIATQQDAGPEDAPLSSSLEVSVVAVKAALLVLRELQKLPAFIVFAVRYFRKWRTLCPNTRCDLVCDEWTLTAAPHDEFGVMGSTFKKHGNARAAVMSLR